jgi:hypothetical protein
MPARRRGQGPGTHWQSHSQLPVADGPVNLTVARLSLVATDPVTATVTLSDGNSEPLSLSARPLPADSGPCSSECDGSRAAG